MGRRGPAVEANGLSSVGPPALRGQVGPQGRGVGSGRGTRELQEGIAEHRGDGANARGDRPRRAHAASIVRIHSHYQALRGRAGRRHRGHRRHSTRPRAAGSAVASRSTGCSGTCLADTAPWHKRAYPAGHAVVAENSGAHCGATSPRKTARRRATQHLAARQGAHCCVVHDADPLPASRTRERAAGYCGSRRGIRLCRLSIAAPRR